MGLVLSLVMMMMVLIPEGGIAEEDSTPYYLRLDSAVEGEIDVMCWSGDSTYHKDLGHQEIAPEDLTSQNVAAIYALAKEFNKIYPNVKVNLYAKADDPNGNDTSWTQELENFKAEHGKYPDVYAANDLPGDLARGMIADLSVYAGDPLYQSFNPGIMATMNYYGFQAGLPQFMQPWGIYVNKELAEENNIDVPDPDWDIDDYTDFITSADNTNFWGTIFSVPTQIIDTGTTTVNAQMAGYGMNFYHNVSYGRTGYKWFYQTTPLIFQNGGKLYNDEGTATAIDSVNSVKGIKELGDLFVAYSLDIQVNEFFNSFRYSALPIGIVDSNNYNLILNGAPELDGQWALAPFLGTKQEDGSIDRWYVAASTGGVIFKDTLKAEAAWEFLKWWTSADVQVEYTYSLRSTYGDVYFWLSSNLDSLRQAPISQEDKQVILEMVDWIRDVPRTPGQYLLERSLSDIWNDIVNKGKSAQVASDERVIEINREIRRKMQEFGYCYQDGNQLRPYVIRDYDWIQQQKDQAMKQGRDEQ